MSYRLPPLNALRAFEAVARHSSVKKAALELSVTPAAVSHQIKALEDYVGVKLFRRLNRALELTAAGRACLPKLQQGFELLAQAAASLRARPSEGILTVSAAPSFCAKWLMPRLLRFFNLHPEIDVRVSARARLMNRSGHGFAAERAMIDDWLEDADVAILLGRGEYPDLHTDHLLSLSVAPLCSPSLINCEHPLREPRDLRHHPLIHDDTGEFFDGTSFWERWLHAAGVSGGIPHGGPHFSHTVLAIEAAVEGLGVVATVPMLAAPELDSGRLVMPFELQVPLESSYLLLSTEAATDRPAVIAFREWLLGEAARATTPA